MSRKSRKFPDVALFFFQLLVNNKIISLDLSVAEVYKKVWCPTNEVRSSVLHTEQKTSLHWLNLVFRIGLIITVCYFCLFFKRESQ